MTKLIIFLTAITTLSFTKLATKVATLAGVSLITNELVAQDNHKINLSNNYPYYIWIDSSEFLKTELPAVDYNQVQNRPALKGVATSADYYELINRPDLNNLPNFYNKQQCDTLFYFLNDSIDKLVTQYQLTQILGDAVTSSELNTALSNYATVSSVNTGLATKFNNPSGTSLQYIKGDGTLATFPTNVTSFVNNAGYITQAYSPTAGEGIKITGSYPSQTIAVDTSVASAGNGAIMYVGKANSAIQNLQNSINGKQPTLVSGTNIKTVETQTLLGSGNIDITKSDVGLSNVDNTSDANKPVSTAVTTALAGKQDVLVSGTNIKTIGGQSILGSGNIALTGTGTVTSVGLTSSSLTVTGSPVTTSGNISVELPNTVTAGTYNSVTVDVKGRVTAGNVATPIAIARSLNTPFRPSTTQNTRVSYSITHTIGLTLVLTSGSSMVYLETSPDNGGAPTGVWTTISQAGYSDGVAVAVVLTKTNTNNVQGEIAAGQWVRLRTVTTGAGSATYTCGQETTF